MCEMNFCEGRLSRPDVLTPPRGGHRKAGAMGAAGERGNEPTRKRVAFAWRPVLPVPAGGGESDRLSKM